MFNIYLGEISISRSKIFFSACLSFIAGIFFVNFFPLERVENNVRWFFISIVFLTASILSKLFIRKKTYPLAFLLLSFFFFGFWRYAFSLEQNTADKIFYYNGQKIQVIGKVIEEPDVRMGKAKYTIETESIFSKKSNGKILLTTGLYPEYKIGDRLRVNCNLKTPEKFEEFRYDRYLARYDIYSICFSDKIVLLNSDKKSSRIKIAAFGLKDKARKLIDNNITEPEAALVRGMVLGDQKGLPDDIKDKFSKLGLSHTIAISGMNISIMIVLLSGLLLSIGINRRLIFYPAMIFICFYIFLIGYPASAVRAGIMGILYLSALHFGRLNKLIHALVISAALMLLQNPKLLLDDIGFQLSFMALLGIICFDPIINAHLNKLKIPDNFIRKILAVTLAAQTLTLPIMVNNFSNLSLIAPFSNLLIVWTLAPIMILSFSALLLGAFIPLPQIFLPAQTVLSYIIFMVEQLSKIPFASLDLEKFNSLLIIAYYLFMIWWYKKQNKSLSPSEFMLKY